MSLLIKGKPRKISETITIVTNDSLLEKINQKLKEKEERKRVWLKKRKDYDLLFKREMRNENPESLTIKNLAMLSEKCYYQIECDEEWIIFLKQLKKCRKDKLNATESK